MLLLCPLFLAWLSSHSQEIQKEAGLWFCMAATLGGLCLSLFLLLHLLSLPRGTTTYQPQISPLRGKQTGRLKMQPKHTVERGAMQRTPDPPRILFSPLREFTHVFFGGPDQTGSGRCNHVMKSWHLSVECGVHANVTKA